MHELICGLDPIARLRRGGVAAEPDPVAAATLAQLAGADGVSVHLREDRAHINDRDVRILRQTVKRGFHMDLAPVPELLKVALEIRPDSLVLVPEQPEDSPVGGIDVQTELAALGEMVRALVDGKIPAALRIDPDLGQVKAAHRVGAHAVQLNTHRYSEDGPDREDQRAHLRDAARLANKLGLRVGAAGGLAARGLRELAGIEAIGRFCVGQSLAARAVLVGMDRAVGELRALLD